MISEILIFLHIVSLSPSQKLNDHINCKNNVIDKTNEEMKTPQWRMIDFIKKCKLENIDDHFTVNQGWYPSSSYWPSGSSYGTLSPSLALRTILQKQDINGMTVKYMNEDIQNKITYVIQNQEAIKEDYNELERRNQSKTYTDPYANIIKESKEINQELLKQMQEKQAYKIALRTGQSQTTVLDDIKNKQSKWEGLKEENLEEDMQYEDRLKKKARANNLFIGSDNFYYGKVYHQTIRKELDEKIKLQSQIFSFAEKSLILDKKNTFHYYRFVASRVAGHRGAMLKTLKEHRDLCKGRESLLKSLKQHRS